MNILITGASGFIGNALLRELAPHHDIFYTSTKGQNLVPKGHYLTDDFRTLNWFSLPKIDYLFHTAACTDTTNYDKKHMFEMNTHQPLKLFQQALDFGTKIIHSSSASVYGNFCKPAQEEFPLNPINTYAESKASLDEQIKKDVVILRYSNVYGGREEEHKGNSSSMVWRLYKQMKDCPPTLFKWGEQTRDFVHVRDVVQANILAMTAPKGIYNIGSNEIHSFNEIITILNDFLGKTWTAHYIDNPFNKNYQSYNLLDTSKAYQTFGYSPKITLTQGVKLL